jgi:hypothetical protein
MSAHLSTAVVNKPLTFFCTLCDYSCEATVTGIGDGAGTSFNADPLGTARAMATSDAEIDAMRTLRAVKCPRCSRRNPAAAQRLRVMYFSPPALLLVIVGAVGWSPYLLSEATRETAIAGWVMTAIAVGAAGLMVLLHSLPRMRSVDARVQFKNATETYRE